MKSRIPSVPASRSVAYRTMLAVAAMALMAPAAAAQQTPFTVESLIGDAVTDIGPQYRDVEDAIRFFRNGDLENAQRSLQAARQKQPQLPPANTMLAELLLAANQGVAARNALYAAVAEDPNDPEAFIVLGNLDFAEGLIVESHLLFEKGKELTQAYTRNQKRKRNLEIRSYAGLAAVAERRGQWDVAEGYLSEWLKLDAAATNALTRLGRAQFEQDKEKEAYQTFQDIYRIDSSLPRPEINMALLYEMKGKRPNAEKLMKLAVERDPTNVNVRLAVAQWALETGQLDLAKENAAEAAKIDADNVAAKMMLGAVARHQKNYPEAERIFRDVNMKFPTNFAALNNLALALVEQPDEAKRRLAMDHAQANVRMNNDANTQAGREAAVTLAWVSFRMGRDVDAQRIIQSALQAGSISAESAYYAARILRDGGNPEVAKRILEPVLGTERFFIHRDDALQLLKELESVPSGGGSGG